ncbi:MAG: CBS domain-containing protein [Ilumatobacter sp.]|jgi:CBS domain-containing protein
MKVRDLTWREPVTIEVDETVAHAARRLADAGVGALIVVDAGRPVGIVTDRDLVVRGLAHGVASDSRIDSLMSMGVVALDADEDADELYALFARQAIRRVPIVDHDTVVGVVSLDDALVSTAGQLGDLAGVLSTQIMFPHAREEPPVPAVFDA